MSLLSGKRWWPKGSKHCFVYCGDDRCDCDGNPEHPDSITSQLKAIHANRSPICPKCELDREICCCFEHYRIQEEKTKDE